MDAREHSQLLVRSLLESSLLVDQIGGFSSFDRAYFPEKISLDEVPTFHFSQKLGHLYEDALEWVLEMSAQVDLLQRGAQVFQPLASGGRHTIGEFDFILRINGELVHLELATKFYLEVRDEHVVFWPGPDARDHWQKKRERMVMHQLRLSQREEARQFLLSAFGVNKIKTFHLLYGCLFHHLDFAPVKVDGIAAAAHWGKWLEVKDWDRALGDKRVWVLPKHLWPCVPDDRLLKCLAKSCKGEIIQKSRDRCVMFTDGVERYFLVSQLWLDAVRNKKASLHDNEA